MEPQIQPQKPQIETKQRYLLLEKYKDACPDAEQKIAYVSRKLEGPFRNIHPIYFVGFHQLIEQSFLRMDTIKLMQILEVFDYVNRTDNILHSKEQSDLTSTIEWIQSIINWIENIIKNSFKPCTFANFQEFYLTTFYEKVFQEYSTSTSSQSEPLSIALTWASSIYLLSAINLMEMDRYHLFEHQFCFLLGTENTSEKKEFYKTISKDRVSSYSNLIEVGMRVYSSIDNHVEVFRKISQFTLVNAIVIFDYEKEESFPFRIGYASNLQGLYALQQEYIYRIKNSLIDLQSSIQIKELYKEKINLIESGLISEIQTLEKNGNLTFNEAEKEKQELVESTKNIKELQNQFQLQTNLLSQLQKAILTKSSNQNNNNYNSHNNDNNTTPDYQDQYYQQSHPVPQPLQEEYQPQNNYKNQNQNPNQIPYGYPQQNPQPNYYSQKQNFLNQNLMQNQGYYQN